MKKIALAPCNGMSPNGLVCRVAVGDLKKENENVISICMGSTSADIENKNTPMLKKYPINFLFECKNTMEWARDILEKALKYSMFKEDNQDKIDKIISELISGDSTKNHSRNLSAEKCKNRFKY